MVETMKECPEENCGMVKKTVIRSLPDTVCQKIPFEACAPDNCNFVPGQPRCHNQTKDQCSPLSLVDEYRGLALIGREVHSDAPPALLCHKEPGQGMQNSPNRNIVEWTSLVEGVM